MSATRTMDWTDEGRRIGVTLDAFHAVVVVGTDPIATAEVALAIARVQAVHRRVALGDLLGDAEPLQALVSGDDPHGLVDSFLFGVSLTRIAHQVPDAGELFIMPTGTAPPDYEELFTNPRWRRLIAGFREVGALLIIAAPAEAPHVHDLVDASDGVVIVGDAVPADVAVAQSLAWVRPRRGATTTIGRPAGAEPVTVTPLTPPGAPSARPSRRMIAGVAGIALAAALAALVFWFARRPFASEIKQRAPTAADSASALTRGALVAESVARVKRDSLVRDSVARAVARGTTPDSFPLLVPANVADSAEAARYAALLSTYTTPAGALMELNGRFARVPASTFGIQTGTRLLSIIAGAYVLRESADSLLRYLRAHGTMSQSSGSVESYPLAFLVDSGVAPNAVATRLSLYARRGQPIYALRQANGTVHLYFGAYANAEQAALAVPQARAAGLVPTLVYRIGRVF